MAAGSNYELKIATKPLQKRPGGVMFDGKTSAVDRSRGKMFVAPVDSLRRLARHRPVQRYHLSPSTTYHIATIHALQTDNRRQTQFCTIYSTVSTLRQKLCTQGPSLHRMHCVK